MRSDFLHDARHQYIGLLDSVYLCSQASLVMLKVIPSTESDICQD